MYRGVIVRNDTRKVFCGFEEWFLPEDPREFMQAPNRIDAALVCNAQRSVAYVHILIAEIEEFLSGVISHEFVACGDVRDYEVFSYESDHDKENLVDPLFLGPGGLSIAPGALRRKAQKRLRLIQSEHQPVIDSYDLPSPLTDRPDERFGDVYWLLDRSGKRAYELGTGDCWQELFQSHEGPIIYEPVARSVLRSFACSPEGGLRWAAGYFRCVIRDVLFFCEGLNFEDVEVCLDGSVPEDFEITGSRYELGAELQTVIEKRADVLSAIWPEDLSVNLPEEEESS